MTTKGKSGTSGKKMEIGTVAILLAFCCMGSFIQRVSGFGFGIFVMTMFPYLLPSYGEATALSGMLACSMSLVVAFRMRKYIVWKEVLPLLGIFTVVSFFAVGAVANFDDKFLKHILGAILIVISIYFFFISEKIKLKPSLLAQVGLGTLSGIMGGLFAMQGPPSLLYFLASCETKEKYIAHSQVYFALGNLMMTFFRAGNGFVTPAVGIAYGCGIVGVIIGTAIGGKVFKKIPHKVLKKIVYVYMAISGIVALLA
ncbi:MAG: sulfite exporter TauE/SafE family protein [Fibrobacter sp.]|nr:sulfite exporter TauE/SafE family protein [Fibrobacter sp.]